MRSRRRSSRRRRRPAPAPLLQNRGLFRSRRDCTFFSQYLQNDKILDFIWAKLNSHLNLSPDRLDPVGVDGAVLRVSVAHLMVHPPAVGCGALYTGKLKYIVRYHSILWHSA